jgi:hypothetical protein
MKKIFLAAGIVIVLILVLYLLIPRSPGITKSITIRGNIKSVSRCFYEKSKWEKWWNANPEFHFDPVNFTENAKWTPAYKIQLQYGDSLVHSVIRLFEISADSVAVIWVVDAPSGNAANKITGYFRNRSVGGNMSGYLQSLKKFAEEERNIYGLPIRNVRVKDSVLISVVKSFDREPAEKDIYPMIRELEQYISSEKGTATNAPMFHTTQLTKDNYEVMIAIPLKNAIRETAQFRTKRMVLGNILEAEVRGGHYTIKQAMEEMENYKADHNKTSPAMSFELLVTDRTLEKDTSKWITRIYSPVL